MQAIQDADCSCSAGSEISAVDPKDRYSYSPGMNTQNPLLHLSVEKLKQVIAIRQQIEGLQEQLAGLVNSNPSASMKGVGQKKMSNAAKAKISAAAKARWAKI